MKPEELERSLRDWGAMDVPDTDELTVARIESRVFGLEWMKPLAMRRVERAIGGGAVEREVGEQRDAALACGLRERAQRIVDRL